MTAALGRLPRVEAGAWVWDDVQVGLPAPLRLKAGTLGACVRDGRGSLGAGDGHPAGRRIASR